MSDESITTSHAHLKELKFETHNLLKVTDEVALASYWLGKIQKSLAKICDEMDNRVA